MPAKHATSPKDFSIFKIKPASPTFRAESGFACLQFSEQPSTPHEGQPAHGFVIPLKNLVNFFMMESSMMCSILQATKSASLACTPRTSVKNSRKSECFLLMPLACASPSFVRTTGLYFSYSTSPFAASEFKADVTDGRLTFSSRAMSLGLAPPSREERLWMASK